MINLYDVQKRHKGAGARRAPRPPRRDDYEYPIEHLATTSPNTSVLGPPLPLSLHTATRRKGKIRGAGPGTLRAPAAARPKAFYPALSMCDMTFSGVFERHPRLTKLTIPR
jgi:hypothetical protein